MGWRSFVGVVFVHFEHELELGQSREPVEAQSWQADVLDGEWEGERFQTPAGREVGAILGGEDGRSSRVVALRSDQLEMAKTGHLRDGRQQFDVESRGLETGAGGEEVAQLLYSGATPANQGETTQLAWVASKQPDRVSLVAEPKRA